MAKKTIKKIPDLIYNVFTSELKMAIEWVGDPPKNKLNLANRLNSNINKLNRMLKQVEKFGNSKSVVKTG